MSTHLIFLFNYPVRLHKIIYRFFKTKNCYFQKFNYKTVDPKTCFLDIYWFIEDLIPQGLTRKPKQALSGRRECGKALRSNTRRMFEIHISVNYSKNNIFRYLQCLKKVRSKKK